MAETDVIRELLVSLGVVIDPKSERERKKFLREIAATRKGLEDLASAALKTGVAFAGMIAAAATAAGVLAVTAGGQAEQIERQARVLQVTNEEYQQLLFTFRKFGAEGDDVSDALATLTDRAKDAQDGMQSFIDDFAMVGITVDELRGKRPIELFDLFADAIQRTEGTQESLAATVRILGDDVGRKLGPALLEGGEGMRAMREEASRLGVVLSDEQLAASEAVAVSWRKLKEVGRSLRIEIGSLLGPSIAAAAEATAEWVAVNREIISRRIEKAIRFLTDSWNALNTVVKSTTGWGLILANIATGAGMLLMFANLAKIKSLLLGIRAVWIGLGSLVGAVAAAMGIAVAPLVIGVLGFVTSVVLLGLAIQDLWVFWNGGNSVLGTNLDLIEDMIPAFGAVRSLIGSLAEALLSSAHNASVMAGALLDGLRPALKLLEPPLRVLASLLATILHSWNAVNALAAAPIQGAADRIRRITGANAAGSAGASLALQSGLSGAVSGQVERITGGNTDSSSRSATVNQSNTFLGDIGSKVGDALESSMRRARLAVEGGAR